jgi:hypothetical protein
MVRAGLYPTIVQTLSFALLSIGVLTSAQAADENTAFKTEWGRPDLQGVWNFSSEIPFQRPAQYGEREFLTEKEINDIKAKLAAEAERRQSRRPINRRTLRLWL